MGKDSERQHYFVALHGLSLLPCLVARPKKHGMEDRKTSCVVRERRSPKESLRLEKDCGGVEADIGEDGKKELGAKDKDTGNDTNNTVTQDEKHRGIGTLA